MIKSQHFLKKAYCKPTFVHNDLILRLTGDKLGRAVNNFCSQDVRLSGGKKHLRTGSQWEIFTRRRLLRTLQKKFHMQIKVCLQYLGSKHAKSTCLVFNIISFDMLKYNVWTVIYIRVANERYKPSLPQTHIHRHQPDPHHHWHD